LASTLGWPAAATLGAAGPAVPTLTLLLGGNALARRGQRGQRRDRQILFDQSLDVAHVVALLGHDEAYGVASGARSGRAANAVHVVARRLHELNINEDPQVMHWQSVYATLHQDWQILLSKIKSANLNDLSLWGLPITDINAFVNSLFNEPDKP
jgi:hypothetical protein